MFKCAKKIANQRDRDILALWNAGISVKMMSKKFGVSLTTINSQIPRLRTLLGEKEVPYRKKNRGKRKPQGEKQRCLSCGETFLTPDKKLIHRCDKCKDNPECLLEDCSVWFLGEGVIVEAVSTLNW